MFIIVKKRRRQAHTFIPAACSGQVYSLGRRIFTIASGLWEAGSYNCKRKVTDFFNF